MNQVTLTTLRQFNKSLIQSTLSTSTRCFASLASTPFPTSKQRVKIIEVSPRDGLQNEKTPLTYTTKVELIRRLGEAGANCIESGAFVSPKWVPQVRSQTIVLLFFPNYPARFCCPTHDTMVSILSLSLSLSHKFPFSYR